MASEYWIGLSTGLAAVAVTQAITSGRTWRANVRADRFESRQLERQIALELSRRELENVYRLQDAAWVYQRALDLRAHERFVVNAPPDVEEWKADERRVLLASSSLFDSRERMRMAASRVMDTRLRELAKQLDESGWQIDSQGLAAVDASYDILRELDARVAELTSQTGLDVTAR